MAHDVIMPMLGMVQDTGIIVSWHKQIGDAVKASDVLMEVETDKATVEIEAGSDGFVTALKAETGVPVPVGQVVAVISENQADVEHAPTTAPAKETPAEAAPPEPAQTEPRAEKTGTPAAPAPANAPHAAQPRPGRAATRTRGGRILASPKARRLAKERGVDLRRLVRLGVPEPIHVADLDEAGATAFGESTASLMRVTIARAPFEDFRQWLAAEAGADVDGTNLWAAFAAGSLRTATGRGRDEDIVVEAARFPDEDGAALANPDRAGLSALTTEPAAGTATLTILDLTETILTDYRPAGDSALPHLTICNGQDKASFDLYLAFDPDVLAAETAYVFLKELADRTQVPLRHVL